MSDLPIVISGHARDQMRERGVDEAEVVAAIRRGEAEPVRQDRTMYRKKFQFSATWRDRYYGTKQVAAIVAPEPDKCVVVTVFAFCF